MDDMDLKDAKAMMDGFRLGRERRIDEALGRLEEAPLKTEEIFGRGSENRWVVALGGLEKFAKKVRFVYDSGGALEDVDKEKQVSKTP